jgi:hypothetical protein
MVVYSIGIYALIGYVFARAYENLFGYTQPVLTFLMASTAGLILSQQHGQRQSLGRVSHRETQIAQVTNDSH